MVVKKIQKGGFLETLSKSFEIIALIAFNVLRGTYYVFKYVFAICPNPDGDVFSGTCFVGKPMDWHLAFKEKHPKATTFNLLTGPGWRLIIMCIKITLFIAVFCLGGPIVLLGGLIFLYVQIYNQLDTRIDDPTKTISDEN